MEIKESPYNFSEMHQRMHFYVDAGILPCCATAVFKGTDLVDLQTFGFMDLETRAAARRCNLSHGVEYKASDFGCANDAPRGGSV